MRKEIVSKNESYYLILDNNVIGRLADAYFDVKNPKPWAKDFYDTIRKNKIKLLGTDLTFFEYLRGSQSYREYRTKLKYLEVLFDVYIAEVDTKDVISMTFMSNIYSHTNACKDKTPSFVDLYLTLVLKNLSDKNISLATFNHKDFPTTFLDRKIQSIDFGYEVGCLCFYKFNESKYKKCFIDFVKAKYNKKRSKKN